MHVLPVALYAAWNINGQIPDREAPRPVATCKAGQALAATEKLLHTRRVEAMAHDRNVAIADISHTLPIQRMNRHYGRHYDTVLQWCTAIRMWSSRSVTREEVDRAQACHDSKRERERVYSALVITDINKRDVLTLM